ncbi:MAG TPA: DNA ligase D [Steroidobacteraceae bacterium]|nr:DNA ligase D [Steroidobacteraceae bacterium]
MARKARPARGSRSTRKAGSRRHKAEPLDTYRAKRDFTRTSEPSGGSGVAQSERLRFVIQRHAARRLHYDLRLELDGTFKSWAVTRGPSVNPGEKRLAVHVEDHPLEYGDFEGTIPKGEYGGGTVQLWDRGYWAPEPGEAAQQALESGELRFVLEGERLAGRWVLVRLREEKNWLLIKRRGDPAGASGLQPDLPDDCSVASGRAMAQIAAGDDPAPRPFMMPGRRGSRDAVWRSNREPVRATRAQAPSSGGSRFRARRTRAEPPPDFVPPQLCRLVERPPSGPGWVHEIKFDGYRLQLRVAGGSVQLRTRRGLDWTEKFGAIADDARNLPDCLLDGEAVALDERGTPSFPLLQAALSANDTRNIVYFAFDLLYVDGADLRGAPLFERKRRLEELLASAEDHRHIVYVDHFEQSAETVLKSVCRMALEGIVSKRLDAPYSSGRGEAWTKAKCRGGQEVVIGGWTRERNELSSLLAGVWSGKRFVYIGRIGTGFSQATANALLKRLRAIEVDARPFDAAPPLPRSREVHWVRPELVAEIEFAGWTGDGMVRQAAFKGIREDKPAREVTVERPASAAEPPTRSARPTRGGARRRAGATARAAMAARTDAAGRAAAAGGAARARAGAAGRAGAGRPTNILGVEISHPEKPLWPDAGDGRPVTKLDLAEYFAVVGDWMMQHLRGRPCSLVRAPDGIGGEHFFQRHAMPGASSLFSLARVSGDRKPYLQIDRVEGLAAAAQIAALELHPWNCEPDRPDRPGRFVFDLDPAPEVPFARVIAAALELKERLESLGLAAFCKTTGGKGLHVVTPLASGSQLDWPAAKTFAQALCTQMASDSPDKYLVNMSKRARTGRIFLDYLRNDRFATAVAPLSPRARAWAPVSMPLNWAQVRTGLSPARFTLRTAPRLLAKERPWRDYEAAARPLEQAVERLMEPAAAERRRGRPAARGTGTKNAGRHSRSRRAHSALGAT